MAVTLAEASNNSQEDYDPAVIDEFRKESTILDALVFDDVVNPSGGGATMTYGYRRLTSQPTAATRAINSEYQPSTVTTSKESVDLAVMGGSFEIDRVIAPIGPAASGAVQLNLTQKIKATVTAFQNEVINGDTEADDNGFDGLDKALAGSDTEFWGGGDPGTITDWSDLDTDAATKFQALDKLDEFLSLLDGTPTLILGNVKALAKVRAIVRRTGLYVRDPIDGLLGANGRPINRETYGGITFADPGNQAGTNDPIIYIGAGDKFTTAVTGSPTGGTFTLTVNGTETDEIAYNASNSAWETAINAVEGAPNVHVTGTSTKTLVFDGDAAVTLTLGTNSLTGGTTPSVTVTAGTGNLTDLYAVRIGLDGFHGVTTVGSQLVRTWLPDFSLAGAVKKGEVELGPVGVALKATKAAAVFRGIQIS